MHSSMSSILSEAFLAELGNLGSIHENVARWDRLCQAEVMRIAVDPNLFSWDMANYAYWVSWIVCWSIVAIQPDSVRICKLHMPVIRAKLYRKHWCQVSPGLARSR